VQSSGGWYDSLKRPAWQPPDVIFGLIWPYNFVLLGIAAWVVAQHLERASVVAWLCWFAASVAAALVWSQQFYGPHQLTVAAVALVVAALLTVPVLVITWHASTVIGALLVPYQLWMFVAASLSIEYARLNL
jgi:benzodiazapine receptor